jgi:DNA polymerase family A/3'-5' exonuclease
VSASATVVTGERLFGACEVPSARGRRARLVGYTESSVVLPAVVERTGVLQGVSLGKACDLVRTAMLRLAGVAVDVETTGYPLGHRWCGLRTVQLGDTQVAVVFDATDPAQARVVRVLLAEAPRLWAHSATADLVPLAHEGLIDWESAWKRMVDTVLLARLADPSRGAAECGLKYLARGLLGDAAVSPTADRARAGLFTTGGWVSNTTAATPVAASGWAQVHSGWVTMVRYAAADVLDTAALATYLPACEPTLLARERTVQYLTARLTYQGLRIDGTRVQALLDEHTRAREQARARVRGFGVANPGSTQQLGAVLKAAGAELPLTTNGNPSVSAPVLETLRDAPGQVGELVAAVLGYRHHDTVIGTFLSPYQQLVSHGDGRVRPTVYTLGTDTGRMSCVRPNLQQLPRQGGIRACITADVGHVLVSADFTGVELRVAAALSGDVTLRKMITGGVDIHGLIARQVFGPQATKADRYAVKRGVFGRLYGGGVPTLAAQVGCSQASAAVMVATLDQMTPQLTRWAVRLRRGVSTGQSAFRTYSGAVVGLPRAYPHKAANYAIQRTARELLVDALLRWQHTPWGEAVLLPVHDEILVMVPESDAVAASEALVACMETELNGVPILAQVSEPSYAWADAA